MPLPDLLPSSWAQRHGPWNELTTGETLYRRLVEGFASLEPAPPSRWFDDEPAPQSPAYVVRWWKDSHVDRCAASERPDAMRRWKAFAALLWCYEQACHTRPLTAGTIDRSALADRLPEFGDDGVRRFAGDAAARADQAARAYLCIRLFGGTLPSARVEVPVALYDKSRGEAFVATLELELLPAGVGEVGVHPGAAFDTTYHAGFCRSMRRAWDLAAGREAADVDGRWRLRCGLTSSSRGLSLDSVDGASASGAAARGWWYALNRKVPDAGIVVLAEVKADLALGPVDFVPDKVRAIVSAGAGADGRSGIDTILVAGSRELDQARRGLGVAAAAGRGVP